MTCGYAKRCRYYQPWHHTCQSRDAYGGRCGAYRTFAAWDAQHRVTLIEKIFYGVKSKQTMEDMV